MPPLSFFHTFYSIAVLAHRTFLEALRSRLVWVSLVFSLVLVATSVAAASVAIYEQSRLIIDVGLASISCVGSGVATAATLFFFGNELSSHTAYIILTRPIPRWTFIASKFMGLWAALWLCLLAMGLSTCLVVKLFGAQVPQGFVAAIWLSGIEMAVVIAVALLFVTLASPGLAASYTVALLLAGNLSADILQLRLGAGEKWLHSAVQGLFYILPDLGTLSMRTWVANDLPAPDGYVTHATWYGLGYATAALILAMFRFERWKAL